MLKPTGKRPFHHHIFMLSLWEEGRSPHKEGQAWRISLEHGQTGERVGFKNLAELTTYLEVWMKNSPD
jgi:hypothetical protein